MLALDYGPNAKACGYQIPFRMAKMLQKENVTPRRVLDCGSGTGLLGRAIRKLWPDSHITGIDFAEAMLAQAKLDGGAQETILSNLMKADWPVEAENYDLVGAASVLNYAPDPHVFISQMTKALAPGGYIVLSYLAGQENGQARTDDGSQVYLWSGKEIEDCFAENGIRVICSRETRSYSGKGLQRVDCIAMGSKL